MKLHKEGFERDIKRYKVEFKRIGIVLAPELKRFELSKPLKWPHLATNLFVEACRTAPWTMGHIMIIMVGAWILRELLL